VSGELEFGEEDRTQALLQVWDLCLALLSTKVSPVTFNSFLSDTRPLSYMGNVVTLGVANPFAREWLESRAANAIRSALEFHLNTSGLQVKIVVMPRETSVPGAASGRKDASDAKKVLQPKLPLDEGEEAGAAEAVVAKPSTTPPRVTSKSSGSRSAAKGAMPTLPGLPLNDRFTFETFVVGRSNRLAFAGAMNVAERPGAVYNPLFLYGGSGLGKTHLLHAIAHAIKRTNPKMRVAYVSGEYFAQHYINALKEHATDEFRRQYREIDVWLVDDIQFIAGKEHTKEEFFHTFNVLYQSGRQVVIASERSPRDLNTMDERLRSRFQSGLIADIGPPDLETRIAILEMCRQREGAEVSDEVLHYIGSAIQSNIRALEGALTRLLAYSSVMGLPPTVELAQNVLGEYLIDKPIPARGLTPEAIIQAVADQFGVDAAEIVGTNRNKDVSLARHVAMYLCRELLPEQRARHIGAAFGRRDHTTFLYACQRIITLQEIDPELRQTILRLRRSLGR